MLLAPALAFAQAALEVPRHAQETRALTEPFEVLDDLPGHIEQARARNDLREEALLRLAESNACRVVSRIDCQRDAAVAARSIGARIGAHELVVRGFVLEASASISAQDFISAEARLSEAESVLRQHPHPLLLADVHLTYSSISVALGNPARSADYARRGIEALGASRAVTIRVRLLRNLARALSRLGDLPGAEQALEAALALVSEGQDPRLRAELHLEGARLAGMRHDHASQRRHGQAAVTLGEAFANAQIQGEGKEALALAAEAAGDAELSTSLFRAAASHFVAAELPREERRVLRQLVPRLAKAGTHDRDAVVMRLVKLEVQLEARDLATRAQDFDARLAYAQHKFEADLLRQGMAAAAQQQRLTTWLIGLAGILCVVLALAALAQRRSARNLRGALRRSQENEARYQALTNHVPAAIAEIDLQERYQQVNTHLTQLVGRPSADIVGRTVREVHGEAMYEQWKPHLQRALGGELSSASARVQTRGQPLFLNSIAAPKRSLDGDVTGVYALTFDVTELKLAQEELEGLARIDSLTGVANRRHFEERLVAVLAHARRMHRGVAVLALDVDNFKGINDTYGHAVGDGVLRELVARIQRCVRKDDFLARLGGDEFVLLVEEPPNGAGEIIAKKLLACTAAPLETHGHQLRATVSIGIALGTGDLSPEQLLETADLALYDAKRAGRNTHAVRHASPAPRPA